MARVVDPGVMLGVMRVTPILQSIRHSMPNGPGQHCGPHEFRTLEEITGFDGQALLPCVLIHVREVMHREQRGRDPYGHPPLLLLRQVLPLLKMLPYHTDIAGPAHIVIEFSEAFDADVDMHIAELLQQRDH